VPLADTDGSGSGARWRVFISHTSELREFPQGESYVAVVERAISAAGHLIVDMADFPATDQPPAQISAERVRGCDVYIGLLGTRYGSPVRDKPEVSYTELEFNTATEAGLPRLMFLLDIEAYDVGIPPSALIDQQFGARQQAFRRWVQDSDVVTQVFADPATLGQLVERSLRELGAPRRRTLGRRVFVAHGRDAPFTASLEDFLEADGLTVLGRADEPRILLPEAIINELSSADAVVADITEANPNIYFELGVAYALGIPSVLIMNEGEHLRLPFDMGGAPVIFYNESDINSMQASVSKAIKRLVRQN
jgi:Domain of unknown function (DUF4062)/Predicted nucleotide-binding protein containing TIR-like domain